MDGNGDFQPFFYMKIWNHPIETTIYKWLLGVPGMYLFFLKRCLFLRPPRRDAVPLRCSLLRQTDWEKFGNVRKSFENSTSCHFTLRCFSPSPLPFSMRKLVFIPYTFIHLHTSIFGPVFLYSLLLKRLLKGSRWKYVLAIDNDNNDKWYMY